MPRLLLRGRAWLRSAVVWLRDGPGEERDEGKTKRWGEIMRSNTLGASGRGLFGGLGGRETEYRRGNY